MKSEDEGIQAVRDVRKAISAEFGNDPKRYIEHLRQEEERYRDRMLRPATSEQNRSDEGGNASR